MTLNTSSDIAADRLARRREHLMTEINKPEPTRSRFRTRWTLGAAAAGTVALVAGGGTWAAIADTPAVTKQDNGIYAIDTSHLHPVYNGRVLTLEQASGFHISSYNRELACQGIYLVFAAQDEQDTYTKQYNVRLKARLSTAAGRDARVDPCTTVTDAPRFVSPAPAASPEPTN